MLDELLNGGANTIATQEDEHDGTDDERSVIVGEYTLVLPTAAELRVFVNDSAFTGRTELDTVRTGIGSSIRAADFLVSDAGVDSHNIWDWGSASIQAIEDTSTSSYTFFQVLPAPGPPTFGTTTIPTQTYPTNTPIFAPLPTASSRARAGSLTYTLTRPGSTPVLPEGLSFDPAMSAITGMTTLSYDGTAGAELVYTVRDARLGTTAPASLTFLARTVDVTVAGDGTVAYQNGAIAALNVGGDAGGNNNNDMRLILPDVHTVTAVAVTFYDPTRVVVPPALGEITFNDVAMNITPDVLTFTAASPATVCLSTEGVPERRSPALYHLPTATDSTWEKTDPVDPDMPGFVCGTTTTFSPFVVGYDTQPPVVTIDDPLDAQFYFVGQAVAATLPPAAAADNMGMLTYTLTPAASIPDGLSFDPDTRTLGGTPTTVTPLVTLTYTAIDDTTAMEPRTFTVTVMPNPTTATTRLNEQILSRASQAMTASTVAAVAARVDAVADGVGAGIAGTTGAGATPTVAYQFGGQSSFARAAGIAWQGDAGRRDGI